jgi:hypothetical protein
MERAEERIREDKLSCLLTLYGLPCWNLALGQLANKDYLLKAFLIQSVLDYGQTDKVVRMGKAPQR